MLKNKFLIGTFVAVLAVFGVLSANKADAATITSTASGAWGTGATWVGGVAPSSTDDVVIASGHVVTLGTSGTTTAASLTINNAGATTGVTLSGATTILSITGAVTVSLPSADGTSTLAVGDATLNAAGITLTGGASPRIAALTASTGTIASSSGITFAGTAAQAQLTTTGAGTITLSGTTGTIGTGGTLSLNAGTTTQFTGSGAQTVNAYGYGILTINKTGGSTATLGGTATVAGTLNVSGGIFDTASGTLTVTGVSTVASGASLLVSNTTGTKTFNGNVVVNGTWTESAAEDVTFGGNLTNNGTFTASTGTHTMGTGALNGTLSIPTLTGTAMTNNGILTVSTSLAGTAMTNVGTLNIGDASSITTLTATASGNTVAYTKAGAQTVHAGDYYNLTLSGSGEKTMAGARAIGYDLVIDTGVTLNTNAADTVSGGLKLGGTWKSASTYGFTGSGAANINTTFFSTGTGVVTNALSHSSGGTTTTTSGGGGGSSSTVATVTAPVVTVPVNTYVGCTSAMGFSTTTGMSCAGMVAPAMIAGCSGNTGYSTTTGASCSGNATVNMPSVPMMMKISTSVSAKSGASSVMALQAALNKALASNTFVALSVDGKWGAKTTAAVKMFQAWAKLSADGKVGPKTSAALNAAVGAM